MSRKYTGPLRVAVLTLTRDRLDLTRRCFRTLNDLAGIDFHHYVLDQGSTDDTPRWLDDNRDRFKGLWLLNENVGVNRGLNMLLDEVRDDRYDVIAKVDNDCELTEPDTLKRAVAAVGPNWILSPRVQGLHNPPPILSEETVRGERVGHLSHIGGIFMAVPAWVYNLGFVYREDAPLWGSDDVDLSHWFRRQGCHVGYLLDVHVNHCLTSAGQEARYPDYFRRKLEENLAPAGR